MQDGNLKPGIVQKKISCAQEVNLILKYIQYLNII